MLVRVRSNVGVWRVDGLDERTATVSDVIEGISRTRPNVVYESPLSQDPPCKQNLDTTQTLSEQGIVHGSMIYCRVDPTTCVDISTKSTGGEGGTNANMENEGTGETGGGSGAHMRRVIDKDGRIKLVPSSDAPASEDRGFRKGMLPLRDMKMQWTLNDFIAMDEQFVFKIQRQESAICKQVSLDIPSITDFQSYLSKFQFKRKRFGFLYGRFVKEDEKNKDAKPTKVRVEAIYEPPQEFDSSTIEGSIPLDDPKEEVVEQIAQMMGIQKVGWIYGSESREDGFVMNSSEIIMTAEYQLEAANGVEETPFVTVKVFPAADGTVSVEAFQVSQQCMAMVAEEALEVDPLQPKFCKVNPTFTAIMEGKESPVVENNFFLTVVPIVQHTSEVFVTEFPKMNRDVDDRTPSHDEMKRTLSKSNTSGWTFEDRLCDFNLLVYLSDFLDVNADFPKICSSLGNRTEQPLDDGYKLIIKSLAGIEGSY